jgi:hypothetical protein
VSAPLNPALAAWLAAHPATETTWIQILIRRAGAGFELRHLADRGADPAALRTVAADELRALASHTADGAFRPLRAAPDLRAGWRCAAADAAALGRALDLLYPGTVADWHAIRAGAATPATYRAHAGRQTGMYRLTQKLADAQAALVAAACCAPRFCLKRRLWTAAADGADADPAGDKSAAPCLEPCAVALEFARKAARLDQGAPRVTPDLAPDEAASVAAALAHVRDHPPAGRRIADLGDPLNPRRLELLLRRHAACWPAPAGDGEAP